MVQISTDKKGKTGLMHIAQGQSLSLQHVSDEIRGVCETRLEKSFPTGFHQGQIIFN